MPNEILFIFAGIAVLFTISLIFQSIAKIRFCALCASVFCAWILSLVLYWNGLMSNLIPTAVLMGASACGIYYTAEKKTKEALHIFRLPFFLTMIFFVYILLGSLSNESAIKNGLFLVVLWLIFVILYKSRNNARMKAIVARIIACCKNW